MTEIDAGSLTMEQWPNISTRNKYGDVIWLPIRHLLNSSSRPNDQMTEIDAGSLTIEQWPNISTIQVWRCNMIANKTNSSSRPNDRD